MLACLLIISNTPSFAAKIIVNDDNSRIVPSRSTSHYESDLDAAYHAQKAQPQIEEEQQTGELQAEEPMQEEQPEQLAEESFEEPVNYVRKDLTEEEIDNLSADFRNELIGTYWNYAELEAQRAYEKQQMNEEQVQEAQPEEVAQEVPMEEPVHEEIADINDEFNMYMMKRRGSREAADYYMIDSIKDPNNAVPSGYPQ